MTGTPNSIENMWENILSRDPMLIRKAFSLLDGSSRTEIIKHLQKMTTQPGWNQAQSVSAKVALEIVTDNL